MVTGCSLVTLNNCTVCVVTGCSLVTLTVWLHCLCGYRVFSAYIKDCEPKPSATNWGKKMIFANLMAEFSNGGGKLLQSI